MIFVFLFPTSLWVTDSKSIHISTNDPGSSICSLVGGHLYCFQFLPVMSKIMYICSQSFPGGSDLKGSTCNVGDLGLLPGLGRSPGEGNSYPLQYSYLWSPVDRGAWQATVCGVTENQTQLGDFHFHICSQGFL